MIETMFIGMRKHVISLMVNEIKNLVPAPTPPMDDGATFVTPSILGGDS